ncbi:phosphotransferase enzyme family protein [Halovenus salina]|uniref:Phosphotransferase enzyme family protein n=1 Tax=Halovenus salina TaxID=1510225 RepID=A0ABD5W6K0_9EURY|nr:aminoglycoside phosphotransferase family protein [Halovenus salina]
MAGPPQRVEHIVEAALSCGVRSCEQATGGRVAQTYLLELDSGPGRAVCKLGGPSVRTGDVIEPLVLELVTETTEIVAPSVLASGLVRENGSTTRWALYEFLDGSPPTPFPSLGDDCSRILRDAGAMLGELHATHAFDRTGGLARNGDDLVVERPAGVWIPEQGRRLAEHAGCDTEDWQPVLTHGDLFPGNLLVDDGATAVLDWGNAHVTTAGYALARAEMRFVDWFWPSLSAATREQLRHELREGYRRYRPLPPDYETLGTAYKLLWLGQSAERLARHVTTSRGRAQLRRHLRSLL